VEVGVGVFDELGWALFPLRERVARIGDASRVRGIVPHPAAPHPPRALRAFGTFSPLRGEKEEGTVAAPRPIPVEVISF